MADYIGRFAPTPSGALHLGSVVAAIGSFVDARAHGGRWHLRFDDLDQARNVAGAEQAITAELIRLGLNWDGDIHRQSDTPQRYQEALERLRVQQRSFPCACTRQVLINGVYPGHCRNGIVAGGIARSVRLRVDSTPIHIDDAVQGPLTQDLSQSCGDFVIHRADGVIAYHLATVVDDALAEVTDVVRGADLLASTPRQVALQQALGSARLRYAHLPLVLGDNQRKLSKHNHAPPTHSLDALTLWRRCLEILGQQQALARHTTSLDALRRNAIDCWSRRAIPPKAAPVAPI